MNVWILNHYATPTHGSAGTRHAVLGKYLQRRGHEVTIFAADIAHVGGKGMFGQGNGRNIGCWTEVIEEAIWRFVPVRPYRNSIERLLSMRSFQTGALQGAAGLKPPDVIVGSCVHPFAVEAALQLSRRYRVPFIYEIRDIWPESLLNVGVLSKWHPLFWYFRALERRAFRCAAGVIGVCPGMASYSLQHNIATDKFLYLPNGVDPELHAGATPRPDGRVGLLRYLGAIGPANGLDTLVEAAEILQRECGDTGPLVEIIGDGTEKVRLEERAARLRLRNLKFSAPVPKAAVAELCNTADGFVYCLRNISVVMEYGLSANKLFDYFAAARPVVSSCSSLNDPVRDAEAGFSVAGEQPGALSAAIRRLCEVSPEDRRRMGRRGQKHVMKHHNLETLAGKLESFLWRMVQKGTAVKGLRAA